MHYMQIRNVESQNLAIWHLASKASALALHADLYRYVD